MSKNKKAVAPKQALKLILENAKILSTRRIMLSEAFGYVLVKDLESGINVPPFDNSAMDGFAIHGDDLTSQQELKIAGEIKAGVLPEIKVKSGVAVSIMTGAPIPEGTAAVVPIENTMYTPSPLGGEGQGEGGRQSSFKITKPVEKGANIRKSGEDIKKGSVLIKAGTRLKPIHVALAASVGAHELTVFNKPKVAIITTGDEIIKPGRPLSKGQIYESNSFLLQGLLKEAGAELVLSVKTRDILSHTIDTLARALMKADVVLTTGGISVGRYDLVAAALEKIGAKKYFDKVAQKPGRPLTFFTYKNIKLILSLPGNPVAVGVCFELYVRPLLLKMAGVRELFRPRLKVLLSQPVNKKAGRTSYLRVLLSKKNGQFIAKTTGSQGSGVLSSLLADGIAVLPAEVEQIRADQRVEVIDLQGNYR